MPKKWRGGDSIKAALFRVNIMPTGVYDRSKSKKRQTPSESQEREIVELRATGMTFKAIGRKVDFSFGVCIRVCRKYDVKVELKRRSVSLIAQEQIRERYREKKLSTTQLAKEYGINSNTVRSIIRDAGELRAETPGALTDEEKEGAAQMYADGLSCHSIGLLFGKNPNNVRAALLSRGVQLRRLGSPEYSVWVSARMQGVSVEEWEGFISTKWQGFVQSAEYKEWRKAVYRRDSFRCKDCNKKGPLEAHHIFRKVLYPHLSLEINNGITLCPSCHDAILRKEEQHAARYLAKIGSTIAPLPFYDKWPDHPITGKRQRKANQLSLW